MRFFTAFVTFCAKWGIPIFSALVAVLLCSTVLTIIALAPVVSGATACTVNAPLTNAVIVVQGLRSQADCDILEQKGYVPIFGIPALDRYACTLSGGFFTTMTVYDSGYQTVASIICQPQP